MVTAPPVRRAWPIAVALLLVLGLTALTARSIRTQSDLAAILPAGTDGAARLLRDAAIHGAAGRLILVGIDGAPAPALARISQAVTGAMAADPDIGLVLNGQQGPEEAERAFLFDHRLLLSPIVDAALFETPALAIGLREVLRGLRSSAAPLVVRYGLPDPVGAMPALIRQLIGPHQPRSVDGVWFAPDRDQALLLVELRAGGLDTAGGAAVIGRLRAAFTAADPGPTRLRLAGPAVFAEAAAHAIRTDVEWLSLASTLLVAALLWWRFRSIWVVAAIAVPVVLALNAAIWAVQAVFGGTQGAALGFGMTMLGVIVDYPVLLIGHRKAGEPAVATWGRIGAALRLTVLATAIGLAGMVFSGFPGLRQLGVLSVAGVVVAAVATRLVLPRLMVAADLAPVPAGPAARLLRLEAWRRHRRWLGVPVLGAVLMLIGASPHWQESLAALSPVPSTALAEDRQLRAALGAPEAGMLIAVRAGDAEAVLEREEALQPILDRLSAAGTIAGAELAATLLPSAARQRARQAALPEAAILAAQLRQAMAGLPFHDGAFQPFLDAVAASRAMPPARPADLPPRLQARLAPMLFAVDGGWCGLIAPRGVTDPAALRTALAGQSGVAVIDIRAETDRVVAQATRAAWRWLAGGAAAALLVVACGLRDRRVLCVAASVAVAGVLSVAMLRLAGTRFSLLHVVALQFVAGIGLDYALFFARRQLDAEERARTLRTLATCNAMTVVTFGTLACCRTPLLREIGLTVAIGAVLAMVCAFLLVGPLPDEDAA